MTKRKPPSAEKLVEHEVTGNEGVFLSFADARKAAAG